MAVGAIEQLHVNLVGGVEVLVPSLPGAVRVFAAVLTAEFPTVLTFGSNDAPFTPVTASFRVKEAVVLPYCEEGWWVFPAGGKIVVDSNPETAAGLLLLYGPI